ncbi:MAG: terminase small subunit [Lentisphaeraceae bacterium]|nr:terminase small subunit [Lentisphaeraceae bacterium]
MPKSSKLTEKQKRFCQEYIKDLNSTQAAIRAGYAKSSAGVIACKLLKKDNVEEYLGELKKTLGEILQYEAEDIIKDIIEIKDRCMQAVPVMVFDHAEKCMVQKENREGQGVWEFNSRDALKALDMLGKHIGFYEKDNRRQVEFTGEPQLVFGDTSKKDEGE